MTVHPRAPVHPTSTVLLHRLLFNQPSPRAPVQPPLHGLLFILPSTVYCSSCPPRGGPVHPALHGVLFILPQPARTIGVLFIHPHRELFIQTPQQRSLFIQRQHRSALVSSSSKGIGRSGSVTRSLQCNRSGSVRAQRLARLQLEPPTSHRNRQLPEIFLPLASTTVFSVMDGPKNVMRLRLRPAQDEKPIFGQDFLS